MSEFFHTTPTWQIALWIVGGALASFAAFVAIANGLPQYFIKRAGLDSGSPDDKGSS